MAQQHRKRSDSARELFDLATYPIRSDFLIDLQFLANRTSCQAQVAVLCAPPERTHWKFSSDAASFRFKNPPKNRPWLVPILSPNLCQCFFGGPP
jgi:hypothetical protein